MNGKRLFRSRKERMLFGVCGGIAEYCNLDPTIIRLAFAIFAATGAGVAAYIIAAIIVPAEGTPL